MKEYMIEIGKTAEGKIIEVPDVLVYTLVFGFIFTLIMIVLKKEEKVKNEKK